MHAAWLEHGPNVINRLIADQPEVFLQAILKIARRIFLAICTPLGWSMGQT